MKSVGLLALVAGIVGVAEMPIDAIDPLTKFTAVGALIFLLVIRELKTGPARDKLFADAIKEIATQQHTDSVALNGTMAEMRIELAAGNKK